MREKFAPKNLYTNILIQYRHRSRWMEIEIEPPTSINLINAVAMAMAMQRSAVYTWYTWYAQKIFSITYFCVRGCVQIASTHILR